MAVPPFVAAISWFSLASAAIPRGLEPSLSSMYDPGRPFACLDGSGLTIPFDQMNDDFCDCADGSDEPGTSACSNGRFYCRNVGFEPLVVPSSRVNDGICDCCDGADEWAGPRQCADACADLGAEIRARRERELQAAREGYAVSRKMVAEAQQLLDSNKNELAAREEELVQLRNDVEAKKAAKEEAEAPEKEALERYREEEERLKKEKEEAERRQAEAEAFDVFDGFDADRDGKVTKEEIKAELKLDTNNDGAVSDEEADFYMAGNGAYDKESFLATGWPLMKPALNVEAAEKEAEQLPSKHHHHKLKHHDVPKAWNEAGQEVDEDGVPVAGEEEEEAEKEEREEEEEEEEEENEYDDYDEEEAAAAEEEKAKGGEDEAKGEEEKAASKYDEETQRLVEEAEKARKEFNEADSMLRKVEHDVMELKKTRETAHGPDNVFLAMKGQCFELKDHEYAYRVCAFDRCTQRGISGGGETGLGNWGEWTGPREDPFGEMTYRNGQACWNGPARSTRVKLVCGRENVLESVSEPNKCEYEMVLSTPAACKPPEHYEKALEEGGDHDEL